MLCKLCPPSLVLNPSVWEGVEEILEAIVGAKPRKSTNTPSISVKVKVLKITL